MVFANSSILPSRFWVSSCKFLGSVSKFWRMMSSADIEIDPVKRVLPSWTTLVMFVDWLSFISIRFIFCFTDKKSIVED